MGVHGLGHVCEVMQCHADVVHTVESRKIEMQKLLAKTDWYVTRFAETGTEIPASIKDYRSAVRAVENQENFPDEVVWPELPN